MPAKRTRKPTNLEQLIKKAVLEAVATLIKDRPPIQPAVPVATNNKELMRKLLSQGRSEEEILEVFRARYAQEGKTDEEWIEARVRIYQRLAERNKGKGSRRPPRAA